VGEGLEANVSEEHAASILRAEIKTQTNTDKFTLQEPQNIITVYFPTTYTIFFSQHTRFNRTSVIISVSWLYYITHHTIGCICAVDIVIYIESINMLELIIRGD
jgi:hypothetical protein